jgi:hypothetical protein
MDRGHILPPKQHEPEHLVAAAAVSTATAAASSTWSNPQAGGPAVIRVTKLWRSQDDLDALIEKARGSDQVASPMGLVKDWEMIELELLGAERDRAVKARSGASCG